MKWIFRLYYKASHWPEYLAPLLDLGLRVYLASVFFKSGFTKVQSWDSTLYLFNDVYHVPLLPPDFAAIHCRKKRQMRVTSAGSAQESAIPTGANLAPGPET